MVGESESVNESDQGSKPRGVALPSRGYVQGVVKKPNASMGMVSHLP